MEKVCRDARGRFEQLRSLLSIQTVSLSSRSAIFMEVSADMYNTFSQVEPAAFGSDRVDYYSLYLAEPLLQGLGIGVRISIPVYIYIYTPFYGRNL